MKPSIQQLPLVNFLDNVLSLHYRTHALKHTTQSINPMPISYRRYEDEDGVDCGPACSGGINHSFRIRKWRISERAIANTTSSTLTLYFPTSRSWTVPRLPESSA